MFKWKGDKVHTQNGMLATLCIVDFIHHKKITETRKSHDIQCYSVC